MVVGRRLPFLLGFSNFSGAFAVKLREGPGAYLEKELPGLVEKKMAKSKQNELV